MADYIPTPGVAQIVQYFSTGTANAANVYHVAKEDGIWTSAAIDAILDAFETWEGLEGAATRAVEVACTGFRATDLTSLEGITRFRTENIAGTVAQPAAPLNSTIAVKLSTGLRGRGTNGRVFWFGLTEDSVDAYSITPLAAAQLVSAIDSLISNVIAAGDFALCVVHQVVGGVKINPRTHSDVLAGAVTDLFLDSQKNRLPGHKRQKRRTPTP